MQIQSLNGIWQLSETGKNDTINAPVPGCVHHALLNNNLIEDPFYRDNETQQLWVGRTNWTYQRTFDISAEFLENHTVYLRCHGLDTIATITLNGTEVAQTANMFRTYEFDVRSLLHIGTNTIGIDFAAPTTYAENMDAEHGALAGWVEPMRINSGAWIRKEPCNYGWDWGPVMVTSGIWRDIELVGIDIARLNDVAILQDHHDSVVDVTVNVAAEVLADGQDLAVDVQIHLNGNMVQTASTQLNDATGSVTLSVDNPQLWWPNGMGDQPLYDVEITLRQGDTQLDMQTKRIGLRTLTLEREADEWGESFAFACNGVRFFAKGANWIPATAYPNDTTDEQYRDLLQSSVDANMNMLRVWGGGYYENDTFYDVCDALGITIWQDFMFACGTYPSTNDDFMTNVKAEAEDNVRRLRHHACIALWCGNNEIEQGLPMSEGWLDSMSWEDYSRLFDDLIGGIVNELAPQTAYWPGSPHSPCGHRSNWANEDCGDTHLWSVWHGKEPYEWYRTRNDRFVSEFGFQSFPEPTTVNEFTLPIDRNITSYIMEFHQRSQIGNATIIHYMLEWFRMPTSFESMVWLSQILQGLAMKYAVEHWRRNMPRSMGTLYWQLNDMWPAPSWSSIDWKGNWKALQYMAKHFYAPVLVSGLEHTEQNTIDIHMTNDLQSVQPTKITWTYTDTQGNVLEQGTSHIDIPANASVCVETIDVTAHVGHHGVRNVLVWLDATTESGHQSRNLVTLARPKHIELTQPTIKTNIVETANHNYDITLTSDVPAMFVWLEVPNARLSDSFFHLRANVPYTVSVHSETTPEVIVQSLFSTFSAS